MANHYRKGTVSLQEAAYQAKVTIYQMMEYLEAEKINPHRNLMKKSYMI